MLLLSIFFSISFQKSPRASDEVPYVPPISVSVEMMTKTGRYGTSAHACPNNKVATEPCGTTAWFNPVSHGSNPPTFSYTFKGEKYQIYGKEDRDHGKLRVYLDDEIVTEINQYTDGEDLSFVCQYTSDIIPYGWHTIKVIPLNDDIEIYKFAYWPSVNAKRLNSTEISPPWEVESDKIGGLREWANENYKTGVKKIKTFQFSKLWVYGSTFINHGDMFFSINGDERFIDVNTTNRIDGALLYESEILPLQNYTVTFSQHIEDCLLYCLYYIEDPQPTPEPISVSVEMMTKTGRYGTSAHACPNDKVATEPCGTTAWFNPVSHSSDPPTFSYTFKGEKYQIYGKEDRDHGKLRVYLDDEIVTEINQYTDGEDVPYVCQYTSDIIPYGWHTIKVIPLNDDIEIYKFAYWPSVNALRLNSTQIAPPWKVESDKIGGLREWANENYKTGVKKSRTIRFSKIWIYGSTYIDHGDMLFTINGKEILINENTTERIDNYLVYESDYMPLDDYTITFTQHVEDCLLHSIFYMPVAKPTPIPISVPIEQMTKTGSYGTSSNECPKKEISEKPCGTTLWYNPVSHSKDVPSFSYKFKGVKYQIYGKYDDSHGSFQLFLDGNFVKEISQKGSMDSYFQLQYTSDVLKYGEHTIKIVPKNGELEIYKFAYWPNLYAERVNSTEIKPLWNPESDKIGGLREWAHENNHAGEKKTITVCCSKIWVYGSTYIDHGELLVVIDGTEIHVNENTTQRVDGVLVYESEYMPLENHTISFSQHVQDCVFNGFYYDPMPSPEPEPEDYIFTDGNCNLGNRCEKKVDNIKENIQVYVQVTDFKGFDNEGNGGAIYIENAALKVNKSDFTKCESKKGGGGAIYIHNTFEITNTYLLQNIHFRQCAAQYGGAVYLYASSTKIDAQILNCQFRDNQANAPLGTSDNKFGGSALYLAVYNGKVDDCVFINNKGPGGIWKIINHFNDKNSNLRVLAAPKESVLISHCSLEMNKNNDCAIFYVRGINGPEFKLFRCKFTGYLADNARFIDGQVISKNSCELVVKSCVFTSDFKKAFKLDKDKMLASIDVKSQVFENSQNEGNGKWKTVYTLVVPIVGVLAVIALIIAFFMKKKLDHKEPLETEIPTEMKDSLL